MAVDKKLSNTMYEAARKACLQKVDQEYDTLPPRRNAEVCYRGCNFKFIINCQSELVTHLFFLDMVGHAVELGQVEEFPFEV